MSPPRCVYPFHLNIKTNKCKKPCKNHEATNPRTKRCVTRSFLRKNYPSYGESFDFDASESRYYKGDFCHHIKNKAPGQPRWNADVTSSTKYDLGKGFKGVKYTLKEVANETEAFYRAIAVGILGSCNAWDSAFQDLIKKKYEQYLEYLGEQSDKKKGYLDWELFQFISRTFGKSKSDQIKDEMYEDPNPQIIQAALDIGIYVVNADNTVVKPDMDDIQPHNEGPPSLSLLLSLGKQPSVYSGYVPHPTHRSKLVRSFMLPGL